MDPNHSALIEVSRKATKSPGTKPLFVRGSWEELPGPFAGRVTSVSVLFPWGSLLRAVAEADPAFVERIAAVSARDTISLEIVTALHPVADASELARLGLTGLTVDKIREAWAASGATVEVRALSADHAFQTTWWRKIRQREGREPSLVQVTLP